MSDAEVDTDYDLEDNSPQTSAYWNTSMSVSEKRTQSNIRERERRTGIKRTLHTLRDVIPNLAGNKRASNAQILKSAICNIRQLAQELNEARRSFKKVEERKNFLKKTCSDLEKAKRDNDYDAVAAIMRRPGLSHLFKEESSSSDDESTDDDVENKIVDPEAADESDDSILSV